MRAGVPTGRQAAGCMLPQQHLLITVGFVATPERPRPMHCRAPLPQPRAPHTRALNA